MTIRVSTLKNEEVRLRLMTIRPNTLSVNWYEGVYHKDSVEKVISCLVLIYKEAQKICMVGMHGIKDFINKRKNEE